MSDLPPWASLFSSGAIFFFVMFVGWLVLMVVWMIRLNKALALFDPILYAGSELEKKGQGYGYC